ncbi:MULTISPECIES: hypothetical protein [Thiorhodovibrio]|uniref:hypothetical protein n=1 Tax=Thiorhodovibrio TaxID=61593 RepID=UPI0019128ECC|nr:MULTISPECIES: hypothetical protein [Thiorhodovibrio]MBK5969599.1 hypothetical protein [Thiorhodovibrio winogradskyi]WPL14667.1 hypothetical protein Thiosp_04522 [Thiorhodovibrio litoralis]
MPSTDTTSLYQAFPHLRKIDDLWGTRGARDLLQSLLYDSREGSRHGFEVDHASALFQLLMEHDSLFPQFDDSRSSDPGAGDPR